MRCRRAWLLLEVTVAIAIFVGASGLLVGVLSDQAASLRARLDRDRAADLARSAISAIEAGLATPQTLAGPVRVGAWLPRRDISALEPGWRFDIDVARAPVTGLTSVVVSVSREIAGRRGEPLAKLHQWVRLSGRADVRAGGNFGEDEP